MCWLSVGVRMSKIKVTVGRVITVDGSPSSFVWFILCYFDELHAMTRCDELVTALQVPQ